MDSIHQARLAQSVEHQTLNRRVVGSSPTVDKKFFILYFVASDALLAGRLAPCKWNQAWRPSELYRCIEREKDNFKSREVNCLKECALALRNEKWQVVLYCVINPPNVSDQLNVWIWLVYVTRGINIQNIRQLIFFLISHFDQISGMIW